MNKLFNPPASEKKENKPLHLMYLLLFNKKKEKMNLFSAVFCLVAFLPIGERGAV